MLQCFAPYWAPPLHYRWWAQQEDGRDGRPSQGHQPSPTPETPLHWPHPTLHGEDHPKGAQSQRCCSQPRVGGYECNVRLWTAQPLHTVGVCVWACVCVGMLCNAHAHTYVVTVRIRPTRELGGNATEPETLNRALHCACNNYSWPSLINLRPHSIWIHAD